MATKLTIVTNPDPRLRQRSAEVSREELALPETQAFLDELEEAMHIYDGIGIAAPQVGVSKRIIVVNLEGHGGAQVLVNPEITQRSFRMADGEEGCLSVPGIFGMVRRHRAVKAKALRRDGTEITLDLKDLPAVILQHEIDHLDGILFIDKVTKYTEAGSSKL